MPGQRMHLCQSVRGALNWDKRMLKRMCKVYTNDDGTHPTPDQLRDYFMDALSEGKEVLPIGECDNFDYKKGCQGHEC